MMPRRGNGVRYSFQCAGKAKRAKRYLAPFLPAGPVP